jgi:serine/threonine protein kinase/Tol biopolymer transport system component
MDSSLWRKIEELFNATLALPPDRRKAYLEVACGADAELRAEVESLVQEAEEQPADFLSEPALSQEAQLLCLGQSETLTGQKLGAYTILRLIGRGGMGEVYLAHDERLERRAAVKLLPAALTQQEDRVRRFRHEARAASAISHPNVAAVYEIGEAEGRLYTAMEFVDGLTLRERLSWGTLNLGEAVDIMKQVASAIAAAHAEGVVHRDIKPENILIRRDGLVKVVDFGLAKLTEPQTPPPHKDLHETQPGGRITRMIHTEPDAQMGTPSYMSPEQARCQEVDARTDVWSLGVVFYEMLAGKPPFTGATKSDVIAEILKSPTPLLQTELPQSLRRILRRTLSKERADRYASARELLGELRDLFRQLADEGLLELPLPLVERAATAGTAGHGAGLPAASQHKGSRRTSIQPDRLSSDAGMLVTAPATVAETGGVTSRPAGVSGPLKVVPAKPAPGPAWVAGAGALLLATVAFVIYSLTSQQVSQRGHDAGPAQVTHLTKDGRIMDAAISGDGTLLAYVPIESGKQSLWVRDLRSGEERQLLPPSLALCWGMRFTPDAQTLLYIITRPDSSVSELHLMPAWGGPSRRLAVNIIAPPAVSPDGRQVAFVRPYPSEHRDALIISGVDGAPEREVASRQHPDRFSSSGASWSPDGKLIALGAGRNNETECAVVVVSIDGGVPTELTPWQWAAVGGTAWDSDGRTLIFSARPLGTRILHLWRLSYPEKEVRQITEDENAYEEVTLAPGANTIVATHTYEVSDIWAANSSGESRRLTTQGHEGADGLVVTPAGRIVYTLGEYEQSTLWDMNMGGGERRRLTENNGFLPSASRDGRFIAYVSTDRGVHHVWLMDADGRNNRRLTDGKGEFSPSITPDGNWVVYASLAKEQSSLWRISTGGGLPVQLTPGAIARRPVVSPDGTMIACAYRANEADGWRIAVLPFDGGVPIKTFDFPSPRNQMIRWTPDSKALMYLDKQDGVHNLWRQPLDGSAATQITNFTEDLILHYDVLSTGANFVLSRGGRRRDIALIKNFR